jgi:hypothetical protein
MFDSETVEARGQILTISRMLMKLRISGICKEKAVKYGPLRFLFSGTVAAESS